MLLGQTFKRYMEKHMEFWEALHGKFVAWKNTWKKHEMTLFFVPSSAISCHLDNYPLRDGFRYALLISVYKGSLKSQTPIDTALLDFCLFRSAF